jgi:ParB-like nuclease domain
VPVLIDENSMILAGHGRLEAAKLLGLKRIPVIKLRGLSEAKAFLPDPLQSGSNRCPELPRCQPYQADGTFPAMQ